MMRVIAFGTFDLLHYGHIKMLETAKELGGEKGELVVVVARDESVLKIKGHLTEIKDNEPIKEGYGKGAFVAIKAMK